MNLNNLNNVELKDRGRTIFIEESLSTTICSNAATAVYAIAAER